MDDQRQAIEVDREVKHVVEALIFASSEPISVESIQDVFQGFSENGRTTHVESMKVASAVDELNREYEANGSAFRIARVAGGFQFSTLPQFAEWVGRLYEEKARRKLSQAALETLAIIAYKQPVSKPELEAIRGVNADYVMRTLLERSLITIVGRAATVGRPLLYGTSKEFLKCFGINDLSELPKPREIDEILSEVDLESDPRYRSLRGKLEEMEEKVDPLPEAVVTTVDVPAGDCNQPETPREDVSHRSGLSEAVHDDNLSPERQERLQQEESPHLADRRTSDPHEHPRQEQPDQSESGSTE